MNENCLEGLQCPGCLQESKLLMRATLWVAVTDDGTDPFDDDLKGRTDVEWDDDTPAECPDCGFDGPLKLFKKGE